jgi:hypothetical protein
VVARYPQHVQVDSTQSSGCQPEGMGEIGHWPATSQRGHGFPGDRIGKDKGFRPRRVRLGLLLDESVWRNTDTEAFTLVVRLVRIRQRVRGSTSGANALPPTPCAS